MPTTEWFTEPCEHGHYDCAQIENGPCGNERDALAAARLATLVARRMLDIPEMADAIGRDYICVDAYGRWINDGATTEFAQAWLDDDSTVNVHIWELD